MAFSAQKFVKNRKSKILLTEKKVLAIIDYIIFCYLNFKKDINVKYSRSYVKNETKHKFEDFLKIRFVENYLKQSKNLYKSSNIEEILFIYEAEKAYKDFNDGKEKSDKIDVYIVNIGLQNVWKGICNEDLYFVIECKILNENRSIINYVTDIKKFCDREHKEHRLPFEGMIAFIEGSAFGIPTIVDKINNQLTKSASIITTRSLIEKTICKDFNGSYNSIHLRNFNRSEFSVYHLFFDYYNKITE